MTTIQHLEPAAAPRRNDVAVLPDAWRSDRIDILVVAPDTDPALAQRALLFASEANGPDRAAEILARAGRSISDKASA